MLNEALKIARELINDFWPSILDVAKMIEAYGDELSELQLREMEKGVVATAIQNLHSN